MDNFFFLKNLILMLFLENSVYFSFQFVQNPYSIYYTLLSLSFFDGVTYTHTTYAYTYCIRYARETGKTAFPFPIERLIGETHFANRFHLNILSDIRVHIIRAYIYIYISGVLYTHRKTHPPSICRVGTSVLQRYRHRYTHFKRNAYRAGILYVIPLSAVRKLDTEK